MKLNDRQPQLLQDVRQALNIPPGHYLRSFLGEHDIPPIRIPGAPKDEKPPITTTDSTIRKRPTII